MIPHKIDDFTGVLKRYRRAGDIDSVMNGFLLSEMYVCEAGEYCGGLGTATGVIADGEG